MSQIYGINYTAKQKLVNLNYQMIRLLQKLERTCTQVKMLEMAYNPTTMTGLKSINL